MGTQLLQGKLWGKQAKNWSEIQEPTALSGYTYTLEQPGLGDKGKELLDLGCGSGLFCKMADAAGFYVAGLDASEPLIEVAKERAPSCKFIVGEIEALPFNDASFNIITAFNSYQYTADIDNAVNESKRVLKNKGKIIAMIWGAKEDCEASAYLSAIGSCLPAPPPGAPGPFALSEKNKLNEIFIRLGFKIKSTADIDANFIYADEETALHGLMSAGPAARAIEHSGFEHVEKTLRKSMQPFIKLQGNVVYKNKFRVLIAEK